MSTYTAMILGPLFRFRGFQQGLWYSHNRDSFILRAGSLAVNDIFTPTRDSFPFKSKKIHSVGHGIDVNKFNLHINESVKRFGIVSVGRISEVKRLDLLISGVIESGLQGAEITLIGPNPRQNNLHGKLIDLAAGNHVSLIFLEPVKNIQLAAILSKYSMCYTGSPNTVDKSAIEGALMGCFVLTENLNVLEQTGMNEVWRTIGQTPPTSISEQIQELSNYENRIDLRIVLRQAAILNNDLKLTARKIYDQVRKNG
jgi:glycosyltransferase involved in cell wall biosynthesis